MWLIYYQYTRPNRKNLFHKERLFNMKKSYGPQIPSVQPALRRLVRDNERFR